MRLVKLAISLAYLLPALANAESEIRFLNPPGLFQPSTFSQIATVREGRLVLISGQTARRAEQHRGSW